MRRLRRETFAACAAIALAACGTARAASTWPVDVAAVARDDVATTTRALQAAIDACANAGGGRVVVPAGTYAVAPIQLRSNVEFHLERGAVLKFSRAFDDYPLAWIDIGNGPQPGVRSPINGEGLTNVAVTGEGEIDGQGDAWRMVKKGKLNDDAWATLVASGGVTDAGGKTWFPNEVVRDRADDLERLIAAKPASLEAFAPYRPLLRPRLVRFANCKNVRLEGVSIRNGANWNVHLCLCDDVTVRGISIQTAASAQNGDGVDFDSCRNVVMSDSTVNAGDDAICLKSGRDAAGRARGRPTENVTIERCTVGTGHGGVVIGSEMSGGVRNVTVADCTFNGTDNGLRFKSNRGRGGVVENVTVRGVKMTGIHGVAILFDLFYAANGTPGPARTTPDETTPSFRNFKISDVTCDGAKTALLVRGLPEMPLHDIAFEHVRLNATRPGLVTDVKGVTFRDVHVTADEPVEVTDPSTVTLTDCTGFAK